MSKKQQVTVWTNDAPTSRVISSDGVLTLDLSMAVMLTHGELASGEWRDLVIQQFIHQLPNIVKVVVKP